MSTSEPTEAIPVKIEATLGRMKDKLELLSEYHKQQKSEQLYTYNRRMSLLDDIIRMAKELQKRG